MNTLSTVARSKSYGLQKKKPKVTPATRPKMPLGFFDQDDEEDEDDQSIGDIQRVNKDMVARQMKAAQSRTTTLTADEAKIYDYDGSYDDFKRESSVRSSLSEPVKNEPVRVTPCFIPTVFKQRDQHVIRDSS